MATTNITIRIDSDLKKNAEELFADLGMNLTTAFTVFAKQAVRVQGLPFMIAKVPNSTTIKAIEDARKGIGLSRSFDSVESLMEDLNADD